jgi:hypothetical protein
MSDPVKSEIKHLENERCRALMARDLKALAALLNVDTVFQATSA